MTNAYNKLYNRKLSSEELAEVRHNLIGLYRELIAADREQASEESGKTTVEHNDTP